MNKKDPLPIDNTGTGKLGSIRVVLKKGEQMSKKRKMYNEERGTWQSYDVCPRCDDIMTEFPALSRRDNKTDICSNCGSVEAMEDFYKERWTDKIYWEVK